jgi:hypothetical protein
MGNLEFQTSLKEQSVTIDGKTYTLRELNGAGQKKWREALGGKVSVGGDGKLVLTDLNIVSPELHLLPLCLFDESNKPVPLNVLQTWPATMLSGLFDAAQELSGLNKAGKEKQEQEAKNS